MIKQVIVIRKDLKMRRGKEIAQGSHASCAFLAECATGKRPLSEVEAEWLSDHFTKVCLQVNSEEELLGVHAAAQSAGLRSSLITDAGKTEFGGVPTKTCLAIGPDYATKIDSVTGHLSLY